MTAKDHFISLHSEELFDLAAVTVAVAVVAVVAAAVAGVLSDRFGILTCVYSKPQQISFTKRT